MLPNSSIAANSLAAGERNESAGERAGDSLAYRRWYCPPKPLS
jgi:hypothetical protein